jgi:hypothetical protein
MGINEAHYFFFWYDMWGGLADFLTTLRLVFPIPEWLVNPFQVTVGWRVRPLFGPFSFGVRRLMASFRRPAAKAL